MCVVAGVCCGGTFCFYIQPLCVFVKGRGCMLCAPYASFASSWWRKSWRVCVRWCPCTCPRAFICPRARVRVRVCVRWCPCTCPRAFICPRARVRVCSCACACVRVLVRVCSCVCARACVLVPVFVVVARVVACVRMCVCYVGLRVYIVTTRV